MKPAVLKHRNGVQLSYDLSSPVYDTHVYPRQSSNGSTVIVYGHDSGLRVVWYAGKKFKAPVAAPDRVNGSGKENAMVIDLSDDDDDPSRSQSAPATVEFEDEEEEIDPDHPYYDVLTHLDIPIGSPALKLAAPHLHSDLFDAAACPSLLRAHAVVGVACADLSVRLVVLPLQPPAPAISNPSKVGVQIIKLLGPGFHQDLVSGLALTYTGDVDDGMEETDSQAQRWSFLVASTSCTGSGLLLIHQVPIKSNRLSDENEDLLPIRREHLRLPLIAARLSFNTSEYPNERHSNLLITIPDASCVKAYRVLRPPSFNRARRASVGTTDSASSTKSGVGLGANNGRFLITLLPDFLPSHAGDPNQRRKRVLDATWILGGRAIIVLLQGGEWGIWDLEAAGPISSASNQNLIKGQSNVTGIVGGSWTKFAIKGTIPSASSTSTTDENAVVVSSGFVPATPHTRKIQAQGLFSASKQPVVSAGLAQDGSISTKTTKDNRNDEAVVISYGSQSIYIPSILSHWKSEVAAKAAFAKVTGTSSLLPTLRTGGEQVKRVLFLPQFSKQDGDSWNARAYPNFLASTSTRLLLSTTPLVESSSKEAAPSQLDHTAPLEFRSADQSLLRQGTLDVDGMDRILEGMNSPARARVPPNTEQVSKSKPNFGKSVNFSQDVDMDATSDMPSPATTNKLQLSMKKGTERRLFS